MRNPATRSEQNFNSNLHFTSVSMEQPNRRLFHHLFSVFLFAFLVSRLPVARPDDLQVLLKLKSALGKSNPRVFDSWKSDSRNGVCGFSGVACNSNGTVEGIELSHRGLTGRVPFGSVCELPSLERLVLGFNHLYGSISKELNNCQRLKYLDLGFNRFDGPFPEISSPNQLEYLYLNGSGISGFPWRSLPNVTGLVALSVGDNPLDPTPFPEEILYLTNLRWLYLSNCGIRGRIPPGIGNLTELQNLEISDSGLTGEIPPEIGKLAKLTQLELYNNSLTGKIPIGVRNLTNLQYFDASMNYLVGDLSELRFLTNLVSLQLFTNKLSGEVPAEFGQFKRLVNLSLYENKFTGPLPRELGSWADFDYIDISENFFTGPIPRDMCKRGTMTALLMLQNRFSGAIPETYANCTTLERFRVSNNSLKGEVPSGIWGLPAVTIIDLGTNQLDGPITSDIKNAKSLAQLFIGYNKFSGELPEEIGSVESLVSIELNNNEFSGKIPGSIGTLKKLTSLHLQINNFSGPIPESIGSCVSLSDLNMAHNSLSDDIPASLGFLPTLNSLNISNNELSGRIPESLSGLRLSLFDLSSNRLSGPIPLSLSIDAYNGSFAGNPDLCSATISSFRRCSMGAAGPSRDVRTLIICLSVAVVVLLAWLGCFLYLKTKEKEQDLESRRETWNMKSFQLLSFREDDILDAIKEENLIGKGGSGNVYRVLLPNGKELAVKYLWHGEPVQRKTRSTTPMLMKKRQGKLKEFDAEVETLSSVRHVNLVKLYCSITSEEASLLVYEYLPNGSLWERLHGAKKSDLDWETRYDIAMGSAKGLEYLHHGCERPVIHRDVKSSNILLDQFLKPRIADFGLAKIVQTKNGGKDSTLEIAGTLGYIAPEFGYACKVSEKCDVYSFGVVLMELVTGRKPIDTQFGESKDIVNWVSSNLKSKDAILNVLVDPKIPATYKEEAVKILRIAILCTARAPASRPTMRSVVQMLEDAGPCRLVSVVIRKDNNDDDDDDDDDRRNGARTVEDVDAGDSKSIK